MTTYAVIMAGGSGTRFWPMSRRRAPKQLLPLWQGKTLLELTVERLGVLWQGDDDAVEVGPTGLERLLVVTGQHLVAPIREVLPELPAENLVVEPSARNTLPCVTLAAAVVRQRDPEAVLGVFSADQHIDEHATFGRACRSGVAAARQGHIATIGIRPTRPETGYGYIHYAKAEGMAYPVDQFREKPDLETACRYLADGRYLWNAGIFFFSLATLDRETQRQRPLYAESAAALSEALASGDAAAVAARWSELDATSLDYGIMEGAEDVVVVPAGFDWHDVGHWGSLDEVLPVDGARNVTGGEVVLRDVRDSVVVSRGGQGKVVAVLGMEGVIVVDTPDATLVVPRSKAQRVREVVEALRAAGRDDLL